MNVNVVLEDDHDSFVQTGGEYAELTLDIHVDKTLIPERQRELIIHAIVENYCRSWPHDKVEELTEKIMDGLEKLEAK